MGIGEEIREKTPTPELRIQDLVTNEVNTVDEPKPNLNRGTHITIF